MRDRLFNKRAGKWAVSMLAAFSAVILMMLINSQPVSAATKTFKATAYTVTLNTANGQARVKGDVTAHRAATGADIRFYALYVDSQLVTSLGNSTSIDTTVDMKNYSVGYHMIRVYLTFNGTMTKDDCDYVPTYIYGTPSNAAKLYDVYSKYFTYSTPSYSRDSSCSLCMEYRPKGAKKWKTKTLSGYGDAKISGLKPNKVYQTRVYWIKKFTYNGKDYVFSGKKKPVKKVSKVRKIRTGLKKLPVRSVQVRATGVKVHRIPHYGKYTGVYLYTETLYTYNLTATVYMKKRPGVKGIYLNGNRLAGNKLVYTKKLGSYMSPSRPRGKSTLHIYSYNNKTYGGYSPIYNKTVRYS